MYTSDIPEGGGVNKQGAIALPLDSTGLLEAINKITSSFLASNNFSQFFDHVLQVVLKVTSSEYGFLSELLHDDQGKPFMRAYAISNVAQGHGKHSFAHFQENGYMDFHALNNLFGYVLLSGEPLLSNSPGEDPRSSGFPKGHRHMDAYLGIPLIASGKVLGMVALANRPGGYTHKLIDWLDPVCSTLSSILISMRNERRRLELEKQAALAQEKSERANHAKTRFLATLSHEIRTPMNAIAGMCDMLKESQLTTPQRYFAEVIGRNSDVLLSVVNSVLDVDKLEAGQMEINEAPFNLKTLLDEVADCVAHQPLKKRVPLLLRYPAELPRIFLGDAAKLRQILVNLVDNALKFTDIGQVVVDVHSHDTSQIEISVTDTGIGMTADAMTQLFELFHQADQSASRKYGGAGLGLAISQRLARLLGATLEAESQPGVGSRFVLKSVLKPFEGAFALDNGQKANQRTLDFSEGPSEALRFSDFEDRPSIRVLLAEDNPINQEIASMMLTDMGCVVDAAFNGMQALEKFSNRAYRLVFMDCQMPEMDGLAATRAIRQVELAKGLPRTPIVALTANALPSDRQTCLDAGMDEYLSKPFKRSHVRQILQRFVFDHHVEQPIRDAFAEQHIPVESPVFDSALMLEVSNGDWGVVERLVVRFQTTLPEQLATLLRLIKAAELETLCAALHRLRGGALGAGFVRFADYLHGLELQLLSQAELNVAEVSAVLQVHAGVVKGWNCRMIRVAESGPKAELPYPQE